MALSRGLNIEDRLIIVSLVVMMEGIVLGALLAEPRSFGITFVHAGWLVVNQCAIWLPGVATRWTMAPLEGRGSDLYSGHVSSTLVRGVCRAGEGLVLYHQRPDALPHAALDHLYLRGLHVCYCYDGP